MTESGSPTSRGMLPQLRETFINVTCYVAKLHIMSLFLLPSSLNVPPLVLKPSANRSLYSVETFHKLNHGSVTFHCNRLRSISLLEHLKISFCVHENQEWATRPLRSVPPSDMIIVNLPPDLISSIDPNPCCPSFHRLVKNISASSLNTPDNLASTTLQCREFQRLTTREKIHTHLGFKPFINVRMSRRPGILHDLSRL